jgi:hypothetical protein
VAIPFIGDIIGAVKDLVSEVVVDKDKRDELKFRLQELEDKANSREFELQMGQIETNKIEAAHTNWFVAGWRPFIGWTAGGGVAWTFVLSPFVEFIARLWGWTGTMPHLDTGQLMVLVTSMLGLGAMRSWDKARGIDISARTSGGSPLPLRDVVNEDTANVEVAGPPKKKKKFRIGFS